MVNMTKFKKPLELAKRYKTDNSGNIALITAISAFVLLGGTALAIDLSRGWFAKERLQDTTDVVALLAAKEGLTDVAELQAAADSVMAVHYPGQTGARIQIIDIKRDGDTVRVEATNQIDTVFAPVMNRDKLDVRVVSTATYAESNLELALVLDTTGSMRGNKIASLKTAANDLIDQLEESGNDNVKVSVVPFAQYVNVGQNMGGQNWMGNRVNGWRGCVGSRTGGYEQRAEYAGVAIPAIPGQLCGAALQPMTDKLNQAKSTISRMEARGWTYMPSGLAWGWRTLDASAPFPNNSKNNTEKVMVLMTDGANTRSKSGIAHTAQDIRDANRTTESLCTQIKRDDITVYTIAYEIDDADTQALVQNCATDRAKFFRAENAGDLKAAFEKIGAAVADLRLAS